MVCSAVLGHFEAKLSGHCDVRIENGRAIVSFDLGEGTFPSVVSFIDFNVSWSR